MQGVAPGWISLCWGDVSGWELCRHRTPTNRLHPELHRSILWGQRLWWLLWHVWRWRVLPGWELHLSHRSGFVRGALPRRLSHAQGPQPQHLRLLSAERADGDAL